MSDDVLIKTILQQYRTRHGNSLDEGEAFERFTAESVLKRFGLPFEEIENGIVDGKNDGGIDSVYLFVNRAVIAPDTEMDSFKDPVEVDLYVIQSKLDAGFNETAIAKLQTSLPNLLKLSANSAQLANLYNSQVLEHFETYREAIKALASQFPSIHVHIIYCTLATAGNSKVAAMISGLEKSVEAAYPKSKCTVELWDAARLYAEAKKQNVFLKQLPFVRAPISHGKGYVLLATLSDYHEFITDGDQIIESLFEFNVRDYQSSAAVNKEIAETLKQTGDSADFWWLNNGVTMLAEKANNQDGALTIRNPIIVNGLQTSHEIFRFFANGGKDENDRCVQVRVLEIEDNDRRDRVIKATNSQTGIRPASLHAMEPFQAKIEDYLFHLGVFYERRKDYWRNKGENTQNVIGIDKMAQSVIAVLLERPHDARARPTTIMRDDTLYQALFSEAVPLSVYHVCSMLYFAVDKYFRSIRKDVDSIYLNNLRYHLIMLLSWRINGSRPIHMARLSKMKVNLTESDIEQEFKKLQKAFDKAGQDDRTAKDATFTDVLKKAGKTSSLGAAAKSKVTPPKKPVKPKTKRSKA